MTESLNNHESAADQVSPSDIIQRIPVTERKTIPVELLMKYKEMIPKFYEDGTLKKEGEIVHLEGKFAAAIDLPNYALLMNNEKIAHLATEMTDEVKSKFTEIAERYGLTINAGAGDLISCSGECQPISFSKFSIEAQLIYNGVLETEKYAPIKDFLEEEGKLDAKIHIAADYPTEPDEHLILQMIPMGDPNDTSTQWTLSVTGKLTRVSELAAQEVTMTDDAFASGEPEDVAPEIRLALPKDIGKRETAILLNTQVLETLGLNVEEISEGDQTVYEIRYPKNADSQTLREILGKLRGGTQPLGTDIKTDPDTASRIIDMAHRMADPFALGVQMDIDEQYNWPKHINPDSINYSGASAFYHIHGCDDLSNTLKEKNNFFRNGTSEEEKARIILEIRERTNAYMIQRISQITNATGACQKETEGTEMGIKLITTWDMYQKCNASPQVIEQSVRESNQMLSEDDFKDDLVEYILSHGYDVNKKILAQHLRNTNFTSITAIDFSSGFTIKEHVSNKFTGGCTGIGGLAISITARSNSFIDKGYFWHDKYEIPLDTRNRIHALQLQGRSIVISPTQYANEYGFYYPDEDILLNDVPLKGVGPRNLCVSPV